MALTVDRPAAEDADAVGILDRYSFDVRFFTEIERFDRKLEKLRRGPKEDRVHFVSICSPNYLHDAHIRLALRVGAHAICEKPIVINPWNLDALEELEHEAGRTVNTVLQLRLHPSLIALKERLAGTPGDADHFPDRGRRPCRPVALAGRNALAFVLHAAHPTRRRRGAGHTKRERG